MEMPQLGDAMYIEKKGGKNYSTNTHVQIFSK